MNIEIHCDGGCRNNQGQENIGGWGAILRYGETLIGIKGGKRNTTNNAMELTSIIKALRKVSDKSIPVRVYMDSQYVIRGVNEWMQNWVSKGWTKSTGKDVANKELWIKLKEEIEKFDDISFAHEKGHAHSTGNILADKLANIAMDEVEMK